MQAKMFDCFLIFKKKMSYEKYFRIKFSIFELFSTFTLENVDVNCLSKNF